MNSRRDRLEAALGKVGISPSYDNVMAWPELVFANSMRYNRKAEAQAGSAQLDALVDAVLAVSNALSALSEDEIFRIDDESARWVKFESGRLSPKIAASPSAVTTTHRILEALSEGIAVERKRSENEKSGYWHSSGRGAEWHARKVASEVARRIITNTDKKPTFGSTSDGRPSTEYTRCVQEIFDIMEINVGFRNPCKWALDQLKKKQI